MRALSGIAISAWKRIGVRFLPFADAASEDLPLGRLLRLSLFQIPVGIAMVLLTGTLNRVMIVELSVATWLVAAMIALPILFAPLRALIGHQSDTHRSALGWRRIPYMWAGAFMQFGGYAILPPALLLLSGEADTTGTTAQIFGQGGAMLAFLLIGFGVHFMQTAGLALTGDLVPEEKRPRAIALLYMMLLIGMVVSALAFSVLLTDFTSQLLIQVIHGVAIFTLAVNCFAMWKQEPRDRERAEHRYEDKPRFAGNWQTFAQQGHTLRLLVATGLGTTAFGMQDVLLEPYGGEILGLSVSQTTLLTALTGSGTLAGFALAIRKFSAGMHACRLAALGATIGLPAFAAVLLAYPFNSVLLFKAGSVLIGLGAGLFIVGSLSAAMELSTKNTTGLAAGAWGGVQATAAGLGIAGGGFLRDTVTSIGATGALGDAMTVPVAGYATVYCLEIALIFATLVAIGPLVRAPSRIEARPRASYGLAELPG